METNVVKQSLPTSEQVEQVRKLVLVGASNYDIIEYIKSNYPVADPPAILHAAMACFERSGFFDPAIVRGWAIEACRDVYGRAIAAEDHQSALKAIKQILDIAKHDYRSSEDEHSDD